MRKQVSTCILGGDGEKMGVRGENRGSVTKIEVDVAKLGNLLYSVLHY
jgi:hypothetical protein